MARIEFESVEEYMAAQPDPVRGVLEQVRGAIRGALPDAEEAISYQIPAFKRNGSAVIYFAGWKQHYSLYPASSDLVQAFENELAGLSISKGTIRFPLSEPVPVQLIGRIAAFRAAEVAKRQKVQSARVAKR